MEGTQQGQSTQTAAMSPSVRGYDADELGRYSSLSLLAVIALVAGIASVLTLLVPVLVFLPVVGIVFALFAIARIAGSDGSLSGTSLARAALFLSAVFLVAGPMRFYVRNTMYEQQSQATAQEWLHLLAEEDFPHAVGMMNPNAIHSLMPPQAPGAPQKQPQIGDIISMLKNSAVYTKLAPALKQGELRCEAVGLGQRGSQPISAVVFNIPGGHSQKLHVNLLRFQPIGAPPIWHIDGWNVVD